MPDRPSATANDPLTWTGERYLPGVGGRVEVEHLHRYAIALRLAQGKDVLDIACGEGYGTKLLAEVARFAAGVDISGQAVAHAERTYSAANVEFRCGSCAAIPYPDDSFDLVVSFETIEHHDLHDEMMREIKRVLRSEGCLLISSPDKLIYSELPGYSNSFHVKELYRHEFSRLLRSYFRHVTIHGQKICCGSLVAPIESGVTVNGFSSAGGDAGSISETDGLLDSSYLIALAGQESLPTLAASFWDATAMLSDEQSTIVPTGLQSVRPLGHYRLGDDIDFRLGGNAPLFQQHGWDTPTVGGTWTIDLDATLLFRMVNWQNGSTPLSIEIEAQGILGAAHPETLMELYINEHLVGAEAFGGAKIHCWSYLVAAGKAPTTELFVDFRILTPAAPKVLGLSEDERELGLLFTRMRISQA